MKLSVKMQNNMYIASIFSSVLKSLNFFSSAKRRGSKKVQRFTSLKVKKLLLSKAINELPCGTVDVGGCDTWPFFTHEVQNVQCQSSCAVYLRHMPWGKSNLLLFRLGRSLSR